MARMRKRSFEHKAAYELRVQRPPGPNRTRPQARGPGPGALAAHALHLSAPERQGRCSRLRSATLAPVGSLEAGVSRRARAKELLSVIRQERAQARKK